MAAESTNGPTSRGVVFEGQLPTTIGNRWALIIGISSYRDERLNLQFAHRDAEELYSLLESPSGGAFEENRIQLLLNEDATSARLTQTVRSFLQKPAKEDLVLIYLACHGAPDPARPRNLYVLTHDTNPADIAGTAVPMREFEYSLRENLLAERIVMFADTCHSAGLAGTLLRTRGADSAGRMNQYLLELKASNPGLALLTSAEANESSFEDEKWGGGHGVFTHYLLEGLRGKADLQPKNGIVTVGELFEYVRDNVKKATDDRQHPSIGTDRFDRRLPLSLPGRERAAELHEQATFQFSEGARDNAAQLWKELLAVYPSHAGAKEGLEKIEQEERDRHRILKNRMHALYNLQRTGGLDFTEYNDALLRVTSDSRDLTADDRDRLTVVLALADGRITVDAYRTTVQLVIDQSKWEEEQERLREEERQRQAEEARRRAADDEKQRWAEAKRKAEEDAQRKAEEEAKRRAADEEKQRQAEAKRKAEEDAQHKAAEAASRRAADQEKQRQAEAKRKAEEDAQRKAAEAASRRAADEEKQREAEAKRKAEEDAPRKAEEEAERRAADEEKQRQAEAKQEAEEGAPRKLPQVVIVFVGFSLLSGVIAVLVGLLQILIGR